MGGWGSAIVIIRKCWPQHHSSPHHAARCGDSCCNPIPAIVDHIHLFERQKLYFLKWFGQKKPSSASFPSIKSSPDARTLGAIQRKQELIWYELILQLIKHWTLRKRGTTRKPMLHLKTTLGCTFWALIAVMRMVSMFWFPRSLSIQTPEEVFISFYVHALIYIFDFDHNWYSINLSSNSDLVAVFRSQRQCLSNHIDPELAFNSYIIKCLNCWLKKSLLTSDRVTSSWVDPGRTGREGEKTRLSIWGKRLSHTIRKWKGWFSLTRWNWKGFSLLGGKCFWEGRRKDKA